MLFKSPFASQAKPSQAKPSRRRSRFTRRLMFETLEDRCLLAVTAYDANDSVLHDQVLDSMVFGDDDQQGPISFNLVSGVSHGALTLDSAGAYEYTPDAGYVGPDSFDFEVTNGTDTDTATASIDVFNTDPVAENASESVSHDDVLQSWVSGDDADLDALSYTLASAAAHGAVSVASDGSYTYTADSGYVGPDSFGFSVSDGVASSTGTVSIDVFNVTTPVADDAGETLLHDHPLQSFVTGHDDDLDALTFALVGDGAHGVAVVNADGSYTYTPDAGYVGSDVFYFTVTDGAASDTGSVSIDIYNAAPTAYVASEDALHDDTLSSSVTADDPDGDALAFSVALQPASGVVSMNSDGTYTYTPETGYIGADSFEFSVSDGAATDLGTVTINVYNPDVLHAQDDLENGAETAVPLRIYPLVNDTGDAIYIESATSDYGTVTPQDLNDDGYDDAIDFQSWDNITEDAYVQYTIEDENGATDTATVFIAFQAGVANNSDPIFIKSPGDDTPTNAYNFTYYLGQRTAGTVYATDPDGDRVTFTATYRDQAFWVHPSGEVQTLRPITTADIGTTFPAFTVTANDGRGRSAEATVTVTVASSVVALDDSMTMRYTAADTEITSPRTVLTNDASSYGATNVVLVQQAQNGQVTLNDDGYFTYSPPNGQPFAANDSFQYRLVDLRTGRESNVATVTITTQQITNLVATVKAMDDHFPATIDTQQNQYTFPSVLANDTYPSNSTPLLAVAHDARFGTVTLNANGTVTYTPKNPNFTAITDTFQYRLIVGLYVRFATVYLDFSEDLTNRQTLSYNGQLPPQFAKPVYVFPLLNGGPQLGDLTATDPNGDALTFLLQSAPPWVRGDQPNPTTYTLSVANNAPLPASGTYTFAAVVKDGNNSAMGAPRRTRRLS